MIGVTAAGLATTGVTSNEGLDGTVFNGTLTDVTVASSGTLTGGVVGLGATVGRTGKRMLGNRKDGKVGRAGNVGNLKGGKVGKAGNVGNLKGGNVGSLNGGW